MSKSVVRYGGDNDLMITLVALPCYNEGLAIGSVVLKARKYVAEVLVVDDGSTRR